MPTLRTAGDRARLSLFKEAEFLRASGKSFPTREYLCRHGGSFEAALANTTKDEIASIVDDDAIWLNDFDPGLNGEQLNAFAIIGAVPGWDPDDTFFTKINTAQADGAALSHPAGSARGRKPGSFWPELCGIVAGDVHDHGVAESKSEAITRILQEAQDCGLKVERTTVQSAVDATYDRLKSHRK